MAAPGTSSPGAHLVPVDEVVDGGGVRLQLLDATGKTLRGGELDPTAPGVISRPVRGGGELRVEVGDAGSTAALDVAACLAESALALVRSEQDLEAMSASSLTLLEQVAMIDEVVGHLPACATSEDVIRLGLRHVAVALSARFAAYVRWDPAADGRCRTEFEVRADGCGGVEERRGPGEWFPASDSLVAPLCRDERSEVLVRVPAGARLGRPGLPEFVAERQLLAVPVRFGDGVRERTLGCLVVADKQANRYSDQDRLGTHETRQLATVARLVGSAIGSRSAAALGKELKLARDIQQQILPAAPPRVAGFDLAGRCATSRAVGGDYYDFVPMADGRTLAVVADVSGHNLASGMLMVAARTALRVHAAGAVAPDEVFTAVGASLHGDLSRTEQFITAAGIAVTPGAARVEVVNAGHCDSLVYRARTGAVERVASEDTVFGFMPGVEYGVADIDLEPGDVVLLITDGVVEAQGADGEMFGEARLDALLTDHGHLSAREILESVFEAVDAYAMGRDVGDDVTVAVVRRRPVEEETQ
ncbi:MAG: PP2C family protein-serine/threonine phosphatase [Planctomycetota bacterium]|nr:PP2C family protein-serine/threonine phosphatase [Planctomycetota bacterium]